MLCESTLLSPDDLDLAEVYDVYLANSVNPFRPEGQKTIPTTNWMFPVLDLGTELPASFGKPPSKVLPVDESDVAANREAWIEKAFAAIR